MKIYFKKKQWKLIPLFTKLIILLTLFMNVSCETEEFLESDSSEKGESLEKTPEAGGIYYLRNRGSGLFMEVRNADNSNGANVQQTTNASGTHRQWEVFNTSDGYVRLRGVDSRKSLTVEDGRNANGANVESRSFDGKDYQEWEILPTSNGFFRMRSRDSRKSISVDNGSSSNGANIEIDAWNGDDRFQWFFVEVGGDSGDGGNDDDDDNDDNDDSQGGGVFGLDPNAEPWENFDLDDWSIDTPAERSNDRCRAVRSNEDEWDDFRDSSSSPYFFTHSDGGMRFVSPVGGATTNDDCNRGFPRSELREMLRRGNTSVSTTGANANNWALGYQPSNNAHGGRNGRLTATLRVNEVTTTGNGLHPGRTIIGQIHADDDEPARLYYRKLPNAEFGCIYLEHEIRNGNDVTFNMIGNEQCSGNGPSNGIRLNELFSYEIINDDEDIIVRVRRGDSNGPVIASVRVDMDEEDSGYDQRNEWMYFKAGAYTQNNTGDDDDRDVITFYRLANSHDSN